MCKEKNCGNNTTKNEKAREIRLTPKALDVLRLIKTMNTNTEEDDYICITKTGKTNTATNLAHRMAVIFENAELKEYTGSLHICRKTFATQMYDDGAKSIMEVYDYEWTDEEI